MKSRFTHIAKIYGIPCYFNEDTMEVKGTNLIFDWLIDARVFLETIFPIDEGFNIEIISELK